MKIPAVVLLFISAVLTQKAPAQDAMMNMQEIAQALGVECGYCHARMGQQTNGPAAVESVTNAPSKQDIARAMMAMTRDINSKVQAATGKQANETTRVTCNTCHHGVTVPGQLSDIITKTALQKSPDAAVAQYRELRTHYYGRAAYDFSEETLLTASQQIVRVKPKDSIPILELNLEFYPRSVRSYIQIAYAYTRSIDDDRAVAALEKALEIEPDNGVVKGQLEQLKSYHRRK